MESSITRERPFPNHDSRLSSNLCELAASDSPEAQGLAKPLSTVLIHPHPASDARVASHLAQFCLLD